MTRLLYMADTHLGASPMGYQQQKGYPERLPEILGAVAEYVAADGGVDFVLHGGDMVDAATDANIAHAAETFDLPVPVYLCLGNHDLTTPDALDRWLRRAPDFFPNGSPEYTIATDDCVVHVAPNHWGETPYYWGDTQNAHFSAEQSACLASDLDTTPGRPHILMTHSPVHGLPVEQTGLPEPHHPPAASFTEAVTSLAREHPTLRCVLGAHNHMNMRVERGGVEYVTVSALIETPFEMKILDIEPGRMSMETVSLAADPGFRGEYDHAKAYVQGRPVDRSFRRTV